MIHNTFSTNRDAAVTVGVIFSLFAFSSGCLSLTGPTSSNSTSDNSSYVTANLSTVFEAYAGNFISRTEYPYEMLLVRGDGLVYYETGSHVRSQQTSKFRMRQGQITPEQVEKLKSLIEKCPSDIESKFGSGQTSFTGPYAFLFSPTREIWENEERDKRIAANFDPFTQTLTAFPDVPDEAQALWAELLIIVKATVPVDVHPDLWPDKYTDERNYVLPPIPSAKL